MLMRLIYLFVFFGAMSVNASDTPRDDYEEFEEYGFKRYRMGNLSYFSPTTVEYHLQSVDEYCYLYWLFHYAWEVKILHGAPSTDETKQKISEIVHTHLSGNNDYKNIRGNIIKYVEPKHLPKQLALKLGMLMALHGNFLKELAQPDQFAKRLELYKNCLLLFSYSLDFSESAPPILQHEDLDALASHPEFSSEVDSCFQKAFATLDEEAWIEKLLKVEQNSKSHNTDHRTISLHQVFGLLRSIYHFFLNNRDSLPISYEPLAAHLCNITTKVALATQKNPNYHLDAANVRIFQSYIDLKKWESICDPTLLPLVETQCVKLMPQSFTLEGMTEKNEYVICEAVRMRNLIPINQGDLKKGKEIFDEFSFSQGEMQQLLLDLYRFFNEMARFCRGYETYIDDLIKDWSFQIYNYVSGYIEIGDLPITQENALEYLFRIKVFDIATAMWNSHYHPVRLPGGSLPKGHQPFGQFYFPRSTYELRKHILKLCPQLRSYEVFTNSINPDKLRHEKEDVTLDEWISESELLRQTCVNELLQKAQKLSVMMEQSPLQGIIVGTRGISGAGKSTFLKQNILSLIPSEEAAEGILNPDTLKATLKKLQGDTLNIQVHEEAVNAFKQLFAEVADKWNYILDRRHLTPHEIVTNLIEPAKKKGGRSVWLYDFDIPLSACFYRILARPLHGAEPCPEYEALIDGYLSLRRYRKQVLDIVIKEDGVSKYELYATTQQRLIAYKIGQRLCILEQELFAESMREPDLTEIEEELSEVIDDVSIANAVTNGFITKEQRGLIEQCKGMTLKKALQLHVQGGKGTFDESLFEPPVFYPFNGAQWLHDRPYLIDFLQNENLLHTHGVDETGRGLHWDAAETGLNPRYDPEGQFQIKLGYFIVPRENVDLHQTMFYALENKELGAEIYEGYYVTAVRFFIHPEAYAHFAPLLRCGIPFVPPSESEYMGTPISSYNTWLVRNLSYVSDPFILKMGTPNGSGDIKHLLASHDVIKSLSHQNKLEKLPKNPDFFLFNESAGIILKDIPGYPGGTIDSGIIFCELPKHLLNEESKMISFDSLISCEAVPALPLIYELMETAIQKGVVNTPTEFLRTYFIDAYLKAIEPIVFKEGYALTGNHLYLTLNADNTIKGFAYRDLQSMSLKKDFWNPILGRTATPILSNF